MGFADGRFGAWDSEGRPRSGREQIDLEELFSHLGDDDRLDTPMPDATRMGHVHLHVGDVDDALRFYHDLVGFDVMGHVPGMGFVSAGGYHHHLGLNEWAGHGARPAPAGSAGLRRFTVELPTQRDLDDVLNRLEGGEVRVTEEAGGYAAVDPSANRVLFKVV
ncbi:MAG TPA: VOC family protein [Candidatus Dormibacteraeota bacterium]|nr:VOC family protein [Candidatus Dormibacteraeota bacterium]